MARFCQVTQPANWKIFSTHPSQLTLLWILNWKINIHKSSHQIKLLFKDLPSFATYWITLAGIIIAFGIKGTSSACEIFPAAVKGTFTQFAAIRWPSTYKHEPCGDVVWLHQGIFVQPDLLWLDHSLEWIQKFCKTEKKQWQIQFFSQFEVMTKNPQKSSAHLE